MKDGNTPVTAPKTQESFFSNNAFSKRYEPLIQTSDMYKTPKNKEFGFGTVDKDGVQKPAKMNLIESVKSQLGALAKKVLHKKPQTKKRWWTKDEVWCEFLIC